MPSYDYHCLKCDVYFEADRAMALETSNLTLAPGCPNCGSCNTERVYGPVPVVYKGGGWAGMNRRCEKMEAEATGAVV